MMERRLAALEGTSGCVATASGMAAILLLVMGLLKAGDHVICSQSVFGSTIKLLQDVMGRFGIQSTLCVADRCGPVALGAAVPTPGCCLPNRRRTRLTEVCDIAALAAIAHGAGCLAGGGQLLLLARAAAAGEASAPTSSSTRAPSTWTARAA